MTIERRWVDSDEASYVVIWEYIMDQLSLDGIEFEYSDKDDGLTSGADYESWAAQFRPGIGNHEICLQHGARFR